MVGRTPLMITLLVALMLSGCTEGGQEPVEEFSAETEVTDGVPSKAGASAGASADADGGDADDASRELRDEPFRFDGSISNFVGACAAGVCHYEGYGEWDVARDVGGIVGASLSLTWDDTATPYLALGIARSCDGSCDFVEVKVGTSPVRLDVSDLDPDHTYRVIAYPLYRCAPGPVFCSAGYQYSVETPFTVEGLVTVV